MPHRELLESFIEEAAEVLSGLEHESNASPWRELERVGVTVKVWHARQPDMTLHPDDLAALVMNEAVKRAGVSADLVEDVYLGCAIPEAEQGLNVARLAALRAGMPDSVGGVTVNRFCSSGLQTIAMAAAAIQTGQADVMLAGGVESMSMVPMSGHNPSPNPDRVDSRPGAYIGMGMTAENVATKYGISREDQDAFAFRSHQRAAAAQDEQRQRRGDDVADDGKEPDQRIQTEARAGARYDERGVERGLDQQRVGAARCGQHDADGRARRFQPEAQEGQQPGQHQRDLPHNDCRPGSG